MLRKRRQVNLKKVKVVDEKGNVESIHFNFSTRTEYSKPEKILSACNGTKNRIDPSSLNVKNSKQIPALILENA